MSDADRLRRAIVEADAFGHHDTPKAICQAIVDVFGLERGNITMRLVALLGAILDVAEADDE